MQSLRSQARRHGLMDTGLWPLRPLIISYTTIRSLTQISSLPSWDLNLFRQQAFCTAEAHRLPRATSHPPAAWTNWFTTSSSTTQPNHEVSQLNLDFWRKHADEPVSLEVTRRDLITQDVKFEKVECPLALLINHINGSGQPIAVYLAQHSLPSLPQALRDDLPTPDIVLRAGKGDVYDSSLWLGKAPTYTPLHRDPNPNLFLQIAGRKAIRLFRPEIGESIFEHVKGRFGAGQRDARFRGEEMMQGEERALLYELVWGERESEEDTYGQQKEELSREYAAISRHAMEAELSAGEALFIPKGWWHSVRGIGEGVVGSVNWWFR